MRDATPPPSLSSSGERRREQILRLALDAAATRGWQRRSRRAAGLALLVIVGIGVAIRFRHATPTPELAEDPSPTPVQPTPPQPRAPVAPTPSVVGVAPAHPARPEIAISQIQTDRGIADRLAIPRATTASWQRLNDDDLLRRLADAGKPAGLAYVDGRPMLLFREDAHAMARGLSAASAPWRATPPPARHAHDGQPF
jgi:hypothetical protein